MLIQGKNLLRVLLALVAFFALIITGLSPLFTGNVAHAADNNQQGAKPGFTTFTLVKRLHGATDKVSPDTKFRVAVRWALPDRMTIADYPNWTPPANPTFMDLTVNTPTPFPTGGKAAFPDGTTIMLEEQLDATAPALPSSLEFGQTTWVEGKRTTHSRKYDTFVGPENQLIELHNTSLPRQILPLPPAPATTMALQARSRLSAPSALRQRFLALLPRRFPPIRPSALRQSGSSPKERLKLTTRDGSLLPTPGT